MLAVEALRILVLKLTYLHSRAKQLSMVDRSGPRTLAKQNRFSSMVEHQDTHVRRNTQTVLGWC